VATNLEGMDIKGLKYVEKSGGKAVSRNQEIYLSAVGSKE